MLDANDDFLMKQSASWRDFEELVERIQRSLNPESEVAANQFLEGHDSGGRRQVDIVIRHTIGTTKLLLIVECKRKTRPIDLKEMEEFIGLKEDVRAHAGIMVSANGFSKRALRIAQKNNIQTFTIAETEKDSWRVSLAASILVEEWILIPRLFRIYRRDGSTSDILDDRKLELIDTTGKEIIPAELVQKLWTDLPEKSVGKFQNTFSVEGHASIVKFLVAFESEVQKSERPASLRLIGLTDAASGLTHTGQLNFETVPSLPPNSRPDFSAFIRTTTVRTTTRISSGLDLNKNWISLQLSTKRPQSFALGKAVRSTPQ